MRMTLFLLLAAALAALTGCQTTTTVNGQPVPRDVNEADPVKRAQIRLQLAATYYAQRQYPIAIEETQRALQANPNSAAAHAMLGLIYMDLNDRTNAEASFGRALRIEPDDPEINNNYGWFLCRTGRQKSAIEHFDRAAANKLYATPSASFYFGLVERDVGQTAEVAWLGLRLMRAQGDLRGERQYAEILRSRFPNSPEAALLRRGAFDE